MLTDVALFAKRYVWQGYLLKQVKPLYDSVGYDYDQDTEPHLEKYVSQIIHSTYYIELSNLYTNPDSTVLEVETCV